MGLRYPEPTLLETDGARLRCGLVPWDTETFGFEVAQVHGLEGEPRGLAAAVAAYDAWCAERGVRFSCARLPLAQRQASSALQAAGFEWIELVVHPVLGLAGAPPAADEADLGLAREDERAAVEAIAAEAFGLQRFQVDPRFPRDLADARYVDWVRRSWADPRDQFLVLRDGGAVAGFWLYELRERSAYLHLTAVAGQAQGRGLGRRLWEAGAAYLHRRGAEEIRTSVSAANLPVVGLYGRLGWRLQDPEVVLHRWHEA